MTVLRRFVCFYFMCLFVLGCANPYERQMQVDGYYKLGVSHLVSGNTQAAFLQFHEALKLDPKNKEVLNALGTVHIELRDFPKAALYFQQAIEQDKTYSEAYNNLGFVHYNLGNYGTAIELCTKALENPLYATPEKAYYNIGRSYYHMKQYGEAVAAFSNAVKRHPNFIQGYYAMALAYNADNKYDRAAESLGVAIGLDTRFQGNLMLAERKFKEALKTSSNREDLEGFLEILHY